MSKDPSAEDLDEEIAQLEEELAELEGDEDASSEGEKKSLKDRVPFLGSSKGDDEDESPEEADETPEESDKDESPVSRLMGRFRSDDPDEDEAPDEEQTDAPLEDASAEESSPPTQRDESETPTEETQPPPVVPDEPPSPPESAEDEGVSVASKRESDRWVKTPQGWKRRDPDEEPLTSEDKEDDEPDAEPATAGALLSRFQKDPEEEPIEEEPAPDPQDPPPPGDEGEDDEDDDRRPLILAGWILLALALIALLAAAAFWLTGAGDDVQAELSSDAFEQDGVLITATGAPITFDASASTGDIETYAWDFGDGSTTTTQDPTVTHTYDERGTYTVTITLEAGRSSDETTRDVRVLEAPEAAPTILHDDEPVAAPGEIGNNVFVGDSATLDGTASTADEDQALTTYEWDVDGDGSPDTTGDQTTTTFDEAGAWEVRLTVTDDIGHSNTQSATVHVGDVHAFENETMPAPAPGEEEQNVTHETGIDMARLGAQPMQIEAVLTYGPGGGDEGPVDPSLEPDLDLSVTSPGGESYQAEDDDGAGGEESLTLTGGDIDSLGTWSWEVTRDVQGGLTGSVSEVEYTLVVHVYY